MVKSFFFAGKAEMGSHFTEKLLGAGYVAASEVGEADAVIVYCESQTELEDAFFDTEGIVQMARKGAYLVDLSPSTPGFAHELGAVSTVSDLHAVEAPLVVHELAGEHVFSRPSDLSCFIAGESEDIEAVSPLLSVFVETLHPTGATGTAQMARAAYTIQIAAQLVSCMETDALYRAFSKSSESAVSLVKGQGLVSSQALGVLEAVRDQRFSGSYTVRMWMAELTAALMAADDVDLILPGAEACMHLLELLAVIGGSEMAPSSLSLVYGDESECSKHGLDWMRAEQSYGDAESEPYDDDDFDAPGDDFPRVFGSYSSN